MKESNNEEENIDEKKDEDKMENKDEKEKEDKKENEDKKEDDDMNENKDKEGKKEKKPKKHKKGKKEKKENKENDEKIKKPKKPGGEENIEEEKFSFERITDSNSNYNFIFRISLVGDCNVGKTSLITRFCDNIYKESSMNTIGVDFRVIDLKYNDELIKLHIYDTAGQERFRSMATGYFKTTHGFMFIYDITKKSTFENLQTWIDIAMNNSNTFGINFLVGNKCDKKEERKVTQNEAEQFAKEKNLIFFETSAKNNRNVKKSFEYLVYKLIKHMKKNEGDYQEVLQKGKGQVLTSDILEKKDDVKKKCGC